MRYLLILFFLIGCAAPQKVIVEYRHPVKYFPEGSMGKSAPYFFSGEGVICDKTGKRVHYYKYSSENETIGSLYYANNIKYK